MAIIKLQITQFSPVSYHLLPLSPQYLPQNSIPTQPIFLPQCDRPSFTPIPNNRQIYSTEYFNLYIFQ